MTPPWWLLEVALDWAGFLALGGLFLFGALMVLGGLALVLQGFFPSERVYLPPPKRPTREVTR